MFLRKRRRFKKETNRVKAIQNLDKTDDFAGFVIFIILLIVFESFVKIEASSLWRISAFFHILHSGGEQTLLFEFVKPAHIAIELSM